MLLLTNGSPDLQRAKLRLSPELSGYFDAIVISGDFGIGKPDTSIFRHALSKLGVAKENAIMVGDNLKTDILGANRIGMRNVRINRRPTDETDIKATYEIAQLSELIPLVKRMSSEVYG
ncbi:HAD family hydrolase [Virgibacillus sp. 179-BFC.A HS]|uniref:HAD family hydrolase n=1 Tax=Tigheibacillus jepli TaxID=3035914 RepID=A0ABU5CLM3_9BACI|nr:HAD family hydrolase [Virgibacillus sp. 179-BFC.A HS]MDY0406388.1 HAD family hydrolase [Virgibacillus sp. 179-BFC.A HS]